LNAHAGHRGRETPRRFTLNGPTIEVAEVLDTWLAPDHRYFKIRRDVMTARWELTMLDRTRAIT
jgi:hypothetical protein